MAFQDYKYETDDGVVISLRMDTVTGAAAGTEPEGDVDLEIHGIVNGGRKREFGVHPRGVRLSQTLGTAPLTFKVYKFLPVLTEAGLAGEGFTKGDTIDIGGTTWTVQSQVKEELN